jgi:hypothetical protein
LDTLVRGENEGAGPMNSGISVGLFVAGLMAWMFPGFNGFLFEPSQVSAGETRILVTVFFVGAVIVWLLPTKYGA